MKRFLIHKKVLIDSATEGACGYTVEYGYNILDEMYTCRVRMTGSNAKITRYSNVEDITQVAEAITQLLREDM